MSRYSQLRRIWSHLPDLPDPNSDLTAWTPDDPAALKAALQPRSVWSAFVDRRIKARIDELIEASRPPPAPAITRETARGVRNLRIAGEPDGVLHIAWDAPDGWTPDLYQVVARGRRHHDQPIADDPFGEYVEAADGTWTRTPRNTWNGLGHERHVDMSQPQTWHPVHRSVLAAAGDGPWQIAVTALGTGFGIVYPDQVLLWPATEPADVGAQQASTDTGPIAANTETAAPLSAGTATGGTPAPEPGPEPERKRRRRRKRRRKRRRGRE